MLMKMAFWGQDQGGDHVCVEVGDGGGGRAVGEGGWVGGRGWGRDGGVEEMMHGHGIVCVAV